MEHLKPFVKICCIQSSEEALIAIRSGASAIGLVSEMPSGPGPISEELIADIVRSLPPSVDTFLLTCKQHTEAVIEQARRTHTSTIQLVDRFPLQGYRELRHALRGIRLVQVIHVLGIETLQEAVTIAPHVDALLLDSGNPYGQIKELGGTGRTHDWSVSCRIREAVTVPIFLAGGLNPENVRHAIECVQPFAVDVCSGVRTNGHLDEQKLNAFFSQIWQTKYE